MELKIPNYSSISRNLARQWWDVNHTYKTNQKFSYYFSCSWHWGFVIVYDKLSEIQKTNIIKWYGWEDKIPFDTVAFNWNTWASKTNAKRREWTVDTTIYQNLRFLIFEEDCAWAIANAILWIFNDWYSISENERTIQAKNTLKTYYPEQYNSYF